MTFLSRKKQLCYVATIPAVVHTFLRPHIQAASKEYDVTVICNHADKYLLDHLNAHIIFLDIERKPSLRNDIKILFQLFILFRQKRFDIVHSIMPKTGLLAMIASWLAHTSIRIHTFTGQVWVTKTGVKRTFLKSIDRLIGILATTLLTDSPSQKEFLIKERILPRDKTSVIGQGSICGVDSSRFFPSQEIKKNIRDTLNIFQEAKIILFVGRLNRDKGILDLAHAFNFVVQQHPNTQLVLVGKEEDVTFNEIKDICHSILNNLHYIPFTSTPEYYMAAADFFCLPSYREGFGMTILEAAACGIPTIGSRIYGITDAIEDNKTGILFSAGNINELVQAIVYLIENTQLCQEMGKASRLRALTYFSSEKITSQMISLYNNLIKGTV